jgi:hypothetical protein
LEVGRYLRRIIDKITKNKKEKLSIKFIYLLKGWVAKTTHHTVHTELLRSTVKIELKFQIKFKYRQMTVH